MFFLMIWPFLFKRDRSATSVMFFIFLFSYGDAPRFILIADRFSLLPLSHRRRGIGSRLHSLILAAHSLLTAFIARRFRAPEKFSFYLLLAFHISEYTLQLPLLIYCCTIFWSAFTLHSRPSAAFQRNGDDARSLARKGASASTSSRSSMPESACHFEESRFYRKEHWSVYQGHQKTWFSATSSQPQYA